VLPDRILVVDGDPEILRAYEAHLSGAGFAVDTARTLVEAADCLADASYDGLITDVDFSPDAKAKGLALVAYVRSYLRQRAPVLIVTAYGRPEWAAMASRLGVDIFLHKPPSLPWLEGVLRDRIGLRRGIPSASS